MKKSLFKRILKGTVIFFGVMVLVLCVHIYIVTRPDPRGIVLARIDLHQNMSPEDANRIATWLYQQKSVAHVYCSPSTQCAIFSYHPMQESGDKICNDLKTALNYTHAQRYVQSEADIANSCPMATSTSFKLIHFIKHIF